MDMPRPLEDLKVLDFTWVIAGPLITKALADLGAEVVKVEHPSWPDQMRNFLPYKDGKPGVNRAGVWATMNAGKRSLAMNLRSDKGRELAIRLATWADVVVENFTAGQMGKWGLDYEALRRHNPDLIMLSASSMGQDGPDARRQGFGFHFAAYAGFTHSTGWPDREPLGAIPYTDYIAPPFAVAAILGALDYRRRTGQGQSIDLSQVEAALHFMTPAFLEYSALGVVPARNGNRSPSAAPHGAYHCKDGRWCAIAVETDARWRAFCRAIGRPELEADPRFASLLARKHNEDHLDALVEAHTASLNADAVTSTLLSAGVPAGVVAGGKDLLEDPQLRARDYFLEMPHAEMGMATAHRNMALFSGLDSGPRRGAPMLGQDTEYVCTRVLGLSDEEMAALIAEGVLG